MDEDNFITTTRNEDVNKSIAVNSTNELLTQVHSATTSARCSQYKLVDILANDQKISSDENSPEDDHKYDSKKMSKKKLAFLCKIYVKESI